MDMSVDHPLRITYTQEEAIICIQLSVLHLDTEFNGKEEFLSRAINKQQLINLITNEMKKRGTSIINAPGDADVEIANAAVDN